MRWYCVLMGLACGVLAALPVAVLCSEALGWVARGLFYIGWDFCLWCALGLVPSALGMAAALRGGGIAGACVVVGGLLAWLFSTLIAAFGVGFAAAVIIAVVVVAYLVSSMAALLRGSDRPGKCGFATALLALGASFFAIMAWAAAVPDFSTRLAAVVGEAGQVAVVAVLAVCALACVVAFVAVVAGARRGRIPVSGADDAGGC